MMIPSVLLLIKVCATIFLPVTLPMNLSSKVIEGVYRFWVTVDTQNSKEWTRSHREDSTVYQLAKHVTAPPNIVVGEHSKNPNWQYPSNTVFHRPMRQPNKITS